MGREVRRILLRKGHWKVVKMGKLYLWGIVESGMSDLLVVIVPGVGVIERGGNRMGGLLVSNSVVIPGTREYLEKQGIRDI